MSSLHSALKDKGCELSSESSRSSAAHLQVELMRDKRSVSGLSPADKLRPLSEAPSFAVAARRPSHSAAAAADQDYLNLNEMSSDAVNKWPQTSVQRMPSPPPVSSEYMNLNTFNVPIQNAPSDPNLKLLTRQPSMPSSQENEQLLRQSLDRQHAPLSPSSTAPALMTLSSTKPAKQLVNGNANGVVGYSEIDQLASRTNRKSSSPAITAPTGSGSRRELANKRGSDAQRPVNRSGQKNNVRQSQAMASHSTANANASANESHVTYTELAEMAPRPRSAERKSSAAPAASPPLQQSQVPARRDSRSLSFQQPTSMKSHQYMELDMTLVSSPPLQQTSPSEGHLVQLHAINGTGTSSSSCGPIAAAPVSATVSASRAACETPSPSQDAVEYTPISADKTQALIEVRRDRMQRRPPGQLTRTAPDAPAFSGSKTQLDRKTNGVKSRAGGTSAAQSGDAASVGVPASRPAHHHNGVPLRGLIGGIFRSARNSQSCE